MMAVWTPGSYLVREYAPQRRGVTATARDGRALDVEKVEQEPLARHDRRRAVDHGDVPRLLPRDVGAHQLGRGSDFALLNGAPTFITLAGSARRAPHEVHHRSCRRRGSASITALPDAPAAGGGHRYRAPDYDTLVDSPIVVGNPAVYEFEVDGKKHFLVNDGEGGVFDGASAARISRRSSAGPHARGARCPYDKYVFFNMITESGGGLEHKNSTVLMTSRWATRTRRALSRLARAGEPRVLPRVERQAAAAGRARAVRLRERETSRSSLWVVGRLHRLLRRPAGASRRACRRATSILDGLIRARSSCCRRRPAGWCSRWRWRRSTRGSSTTGPTRTRPTRRSATTRRAR